MEYSKANGNTVTSVIDREIVVNRLIWCTS
jgi:hypothetical protein